MAKKYNIKWRDADRAKLASRVRVFNAKRTRLIKQVPELEEFLPEKVSVKELKEQISTRSDYNSVIKRLNRFMIKGAENIVTTEAGVRTTRYELKETQLAIRNINQRRARMRAEANVSTYKGTMGSLKDMNLRPLKTKAEKISPEMWEKTKQSLKNRTLDSYYNDHDRLYKDNFLKAWDDAYGDSKEAARLRKRLEKIPADVIVNMYYYDPNLQIGFHYPTSDEEISQNLAWFENTLDNYMEEFGYNY